MNGGISVVGLEILVPRIDDALAFFSEVLDFEVAYRGPANGIAGEAAVLDGGTIAITLIEATETAAPVMVPREPRVTQLVLGLGPDGVARCVDRVRSSGVVVRDLDDGRAFVPPEVARGILGFDMAIMFSEVQT